MSALEDAKDRLRVASIAVGIAEREHRAANTPLTRDALTLARDAETLAQIAADRALLDEMREESRELIAEARAALDAAIDRKHGALAEQGESRGYGGTFHPQMRLFNDDIDAAMNALDELETPIRRAEFDLRWAENSYRRLCAEREAIDNHCCLDYTEHRENHPREQRWEATTDMYAARDFTPMVEALKRGERDNG